MSKRRLARELSACNYSLKAARALTPVVSALLITGCQTLWWGHSDGDIPVAEPRTLASLTSLNTEPATELNERGGTPEQLPADRVSLEAVMRSYQDLLPLVEDPVKQITIRHRLADLEFARAERILTDSAEDDLSGAIAAYTSLLADYPERDGNDQIYYQLARAYELRGMTSEQLGALDTLVANYPGSAYWEEAQFRRGDILFINGRYSEAEQAFDEVTRASSARNSDSSFEMNAHYMKGWSQFKQGDYQQALYSYIAVLDLIMPVEGLAEMPDQPYQTLSEDLFRVFGLSLSYLDGAETLQSLFRQTGSRPYETLVYDRYASLLIERERYTDAIAVFDAYVEERPRSRWAPRYSMRAIDTLELAGFDKFIPDRKAGFVESYGIYSDFWPEADHETQAYIESQLERLLPELADRHYLLAGEERKNARKPQTPRNHEANRSERSLSADEHYRQAAAYYAEFAATFPDHPRTPERLFLLAETYVDLREWPDAISAFERVAYDFPAAGSVFDRAAEAGYASVLAYREYARSWMVETTVDLFALQEMQQLNRLRFVNAYPEDPRGPRVYYIALQREFDQQNLEEVIPMAERLATWTPAADPMLVTEALLLAGHSLFELGRYAEAEQTYRDALAMMAAEDDRRSGIEENMAAAVFRQAEQLARAGNLDAAVSEYLRVGAVAPASILNANAQYDAASLLVGAARWDEAINVLTGFRSRFPDHLLIQTVPAKLALAYRETGQWEKAGDELNLMVAMATTPEERRQNLQIAAELYDQAGNQAKAIDTWRQYANRHPEPADTFMEAANRLAELYQIRGDIEKRNFWLNRQMEKVDQSPELVDERMRYLAASASATLARGALARYDSIRLTLPLNKSMVAKTNALETAVRAYQKTASYGLSSYATEAGYQIAHIYSRLGADLMDSERPEGLSELELSQYELLLEEQAYPFEDNAIDIHEQNILRAREGIFDEWIQRSYESLRRLLPGRYNKPEVTAEVVHELG